MKFKTLLLTLIAAPTMALFADNVNPCDPCQTFCDPCVTTCDPCYYEPYDCVCDPCDCYDFCDPCHGWNFYVDWLIWKVRRSGLDYAVRLESGSPNGRIDSIEPDLDSGIRAGLFKECGCLNFGLRYTYFDTSDSNNVETDTGFFGAMRPSPESDPSIIVNAGASEARSNYEIELHMLDVELGYRWDLCCIDGFARPLVGAKFTFIDQDLDTTYLRIDGSAPTPSLQTIESLYMDAYGLYGGIEGFWNIWYRVSVFGRATAGLHVAEFESRHRDFDTTGGISDVTIDAKKDETLIVSNFEVATGVQFDICDMGCIDWQIQIGYEYHHWDGMPDFLNFINTSGNGKLDRSGSSLGWDGIYVRLSGRY